MEQTHPTVLHVINHTHWDREWFVPFTVTRRWIPSLIRNLGKVAHNNPGYTFLFDAQTMVIEDLEVANKEAYGLACTLIRNKQLEIGPYYAQLEMRMSGAETLVRNLRIGTAKAKELKASSDFTAWDVDAFGHVSQSPQIHSMFGIDSAYMWRGPHELAPFFWWKGADGTTMLGVNLFAGGYRNFYKVASIDRLAMSRLQHEVRKLRPFYKHGHIPVFDGFDLDREPGDAAAYFAKHHADRLKQDGIVVENSSPYKFAKTIRTLGDNFPLLKGELNSGKYSSVFPGLLSARVYSKLLGAHMEQLLYRYAEPASLLLPAAQYPEALFETQTKRILQNFVHDVISGCSIDQVHETAELRAQDVAQAAEDAVQKALASAAPRLENGTYAYIPAVGHTDTRVAVDTALYEVRGRGVGIVKVSSVSSLQPEKREVQRFTWRNAHYKAVLRSGGVLKIGKGQFGQLVVRKDNGDTYWDEPRGRTTALRVAGPITLDYETNEYAELSFTARTNSKKYQAVVRVTLTFDQSRMIRWRLTVQTTGTGFSVSLRHRYGHELSRLNAGMAFDTVQRGMEDTDLLGRDLHPSMRSVLIAQRDIYQTFTFPFHSYVTPEDNPDHVHIVAKGLRAYQTDKPDVIDLVLCRPTEWVMRPGFHQYHTGDAGPKYLVPGALGQREMVIECGLLVDEAGPNSMQFHQQVDQFVHPPLLFTVQGSTGTETHISLFDEEVPITSVHQYQGKRMARICNPTDAPLVLKRTYARTTHENKSTGALSELSPKAIATIALSDDKQYEASAVGRTTIAVLNWPIYPVGPDTAQIQPESLKVLVGLHKKLKRQHATLEAEIKTLGDDAPSALLHRYYVVTRELMEAALSIKWNEIRAAGAQPDPEEMYAFAIDPELYDMASQYNDMRIIRRMYDYIVDIDEKGREEARPADHSL